jgi:hypothetical protein
MSSGLAAVSFDQGQCLVVVRSQAPAVPSCNPHPSADTHKLQHIHDNIAAQYTQPATQLALLLAVKRRSRDPPAGIPTCRCSICRANLPEGVLQHAVAGAAAGGCGRVPAAAAARAAAAAAAATMDLRTGCWRQLHLWRQ